MEVTDGVKVIRMKRGQKLPHCTKAVDRRSRWGNPFLMGRDGNRRQVVEKYPEHVLSSPGLLDGLEALRGFDLACWCHEWDGSGANPMFCHADVLLELANGERLTQEVIDGRQD